MDILDMLNILALAGVSITGLILRSYFPKYVEKKAENLATKEDIGEITSIVEGIRRDNAIELEKLAQSHRYEIKNIEQLNNLKMAAIDKRLEVYQEAYELVFGMLEAIGHREREISILTRATTFWKTRSLYISEEVREKIDKAMMATNAHSSTLHDSSPVKPEENRKKISDALRAIESAVNLPSFVNVAEEEANKSLNRTDR